jgi:hypothetical protein
VATQLADGQTTAFQVAARQRHRLARGAQVQERLSAAGLVRVVVDLAAEPFEDAKRRQARAGSELVDVAGHEESDTHAGGA